MSILFYLKDIHTLYIILLIIALKNKKQCEKYIVFSLTSIFFYFFAHENKQ